MISKELIEELGWVYRPDTFARERNLPITHYWFTKDGFGLTFYVDNNTVKITDDRVHHFQPIVVFDFKLDDIEQLKDIMKIMHL